ncbi:hypothetical protein KSC_021070 [Ktedonobacter sp. SOSP1-52]|uniref:FAD-binding oxidoreductase n=1 Tax=Ktedonobacter sp. SOSP1-52 TaxID=2778366 RepID=UPI0019158D92|nr:FAD-binding protein [Ktedonobacter sp. SOSP1-52]GHO63215.1 hypothetical protein KSC_021070 [Ktedonobacter sp. SOSP1-52]
MSTIHRYDHSFFADLLAPLTGQLILPGDGAYEHVRQLWNGKVDIHPAAFVRCANTQDVIHTVQWTRSHGLPLSVLGGGNDFAGRALSENGIVIDCSQMRAVAIDPGARTAHVQGGHTHSSALAAKLH